MDAKVLHDSARGHDIESVINSAKLIKESGINLGLQMMVGLPSDTEEKCIETAKRFIELDPFCVRIYPTLVVKDTGLEMLLDRGEYKPFTLEESISIVKKLLVLCQQHKCHKSWASSYRGYTTWERYSRWTLSSSF